MCLFRPKLLKDDQLEKFQAEDITGDIFLNHAGDVRFFKEVCGLRAGPSNRLANLAKESAEAEAELEAEVEDVEMLDVSDIKSKFLSAVL